MSLRDRYGSRARGGAHQTWVFVGLLVVGVWLSIAPFALGYQSVGVPLRATVNDSVVGVAVVALALVGLCRPAR